MVTDDRVARWFVGLCLVVSSAFATDVRVTYLANEGVLIEQGRSKILIDALFRDSLDPYVRHTPEIQQKLETGAPPYEGVALALATHYHLDHWDAGATARFLRSNPQALFASTVEGTAMLPTQLQPRVRRLDGNGNRIEVAGIAVEAFSLRHSRWPNLGYRIGLGGRTVAHLGDAEPSEENFKALMARPSVDIAMVPFWWLLDSKGVAFINETWKPKHVVAFHIGSSDDKSAKEISVQRPQTWVCQRPGESRTF